MRIYSRRNRNSIRYYLRCLCAGGTEMDFWTLVMGLTMLLFIILWPAAVGAQTAPTQCHCWPGGPGCVCDIGTIPPVHGAICDPAGGDISGCEKMFLPEVKTT